ncbi:MAG: RNA polymerase sigma factor [Rickettsiales bacterium]
MSDETDRWVTLAKRGDRAAFQNLLRAHYAMIYRVSYRFTGHSADAEDVAQEVCMALADKLQSYKGGSSFTTWLYRVVVNQSRDFHKKRGADRARDTQYVELEAMHAADASEDNRKTAWLYRALEGLGSPYKETALLVLAEELSHAEAAKILDCKESTISWRMHEIRNKLTQAMEGYHE